MPCIRLKSWSFGIKSVCEDKNRTLNNDDGCHPWWRADHHHIGRDGMSQIWLTSISDDEVHIHRPSSRDDRRLSYSHNHQRVMGIPRERVTTVIPLTVRPSPLTKWLFAINMTFHSDVVPDIFFMLFEVESAR